MYTITLATGILVINDVLFGFVSMSHIHWFVRFLLCSFIEYITLRYNNRLRIGVRNEN
jgi:hypothetical protein